MRFAFSWQHSDDRLASRHLIPRLDPHLRLLRQIEVHARPEPDQPVPLAPRDPLPFGEPADDAPRHVPGHLHAQHALAPVSLEQRRHLFETDGGQRVLCVQVAGYVARRIVCWLTEGERVARGERYGLIRFGSRMDLYLPKETEMRIKTGDKVTGGESIIGVWP